jgi:hypothetical protein
VTSVPEVRWARTVDGACIAYQDLGGGPVTLVVIHGWVSHLEVYWEQPRYVRFLSRLSRNMRVIVFVSSTVKDLVAGSGLVFQDRGEHRLKGVPEVWHLYALAPSDA